MSLFGNTENYELRLPMSYPQAFDLVILAANKCGKVKSQNKTLGLIQFKATSGISNPVKFSVNISGQEDKVTLVRLSASCGDGVIGLNSVGRVYDKFIKCLDKVSD